MVSHTWKSQRISAVFNRVSRSKAIALNYPFYWDNTVCENGHKAFRRTSSGECIRCESATQRKPPTEINTSRMIDIDAIHEDRRNQAQLKEVWDTDHDI